MAAETTPVRRAGPKAAQVLEELAERRRRSLVVSEDKTWLAEVTPHYAQLLDNMEASQLLYRIARGRYVVAPRGTFTATQAVPVELMCALVLRDQGDYYLGYLTALISHRLTDLHSSTIYASVRQSSNFRESEVELPGGTLHVMRLADSRWPTLDGELAWARALPDSKEFVWRAGIERTLADALARPDLCAGMETVVGCWARARQREVDWDLACQIAASQGKSMARRVAFILRLLGMSAVAAENFPHLMARGASTPLDRSRGFDLAADEIRRDRQTGVLVNVPERSLIGWARAAALP
jgi:predicted transcriptional regulator of viral defense system